MRIRDDQIHVEVEEVSKTFALGARTERAVETEQLRDRIKVIAAAYLALHPVAELQSGPGRSVELDECPSGEQILRNFSVALQHRNTFRATEAKGSFQRVPQALASDSSRQTIDDNNELG